MAHSANFNVYDVLEPLKCPIKPVTDSSVGILIDINDDTDNICKDLSGSDLDTIKKSEFDLVDLYQNIYVTPHHVKNQDVKREDNIHFSFNEKCELGDEFKAIEQKNNKPIVLTETDIEELLKGTYESNRDISSTTCLNYADMETENWCKHHNYTARNAENSLSCNVPTQDKPNWIRNGMSNDVKNSVTNSDIIDFLNKSYKTEDGSGNSTINSLFKNKELKEKLDWIKSRKDLREALINELLNTSDTGNNTKSHSPAIRKVLKPPIGDDIFKTDKTQMQNNNSQTSSLRSTVNIDKVFGGFKATQNNIDLSIKNLILKANHETPTAFRIVPNSKVNNTPKENIQLLQTAKLDKKAYAKRHIKTDLEKIGYTKGPSLYEKSVVLPQILNKLAARKEALIEEDQLKRRLILDFGKQANECKCSGDLNPKLHKEPANKKTVVNAVEGMSSSNDFELNPVIAMENCNRERILAHRVRSAFEKFIHTGSYY